MDILQILKSASAFILLSVLFLSSQALKRFLKCMHCR